MRLLSVYTQFIYSPKRPKLETSQDQTLASVQKYKYRNNARTILEVRQDITNGKEPTKIAAIVSKEVVKQLLLEKNVEYDTSMPLSKNYERLEDAYTQIRGSIEFGYLPVSEVESLTTQRNFEFPHFPTESLCYCTCTDGCISASCQCKMITWKDNREESYTRVKNVERKVIRKFDDRSALTFPYKDGKLIEQVRDDPENGGYGTDIITECNSLCACQTATANVKCSNHVVQDGIQVKLELFLSRKGWGVQACQHIPKGSFVGTYTGRLQPVESKQAREGGLGKVRTKGNSGYKRFQKTVDPG